jgi:hypothetical protein
MPFSLPLAGRVEDGAFTLTDQRARRPIQAPRIAWKGVSAIAMAQTVHQLRGDR